MKSIKPLGLSSLIAFLAIVAHSTPPEDFETRVIATGLTRPVGIVAGNDQDVYFTEVPAPGTPNAGNAVKKLHLRDSHITTLHEGEPEPVNIAVDRWGQFYWTCKSAGVILTQDRDGGTTPVLTGLQHPSGIAVDRWGQIFFTLIPTPGIPGNNGGSNLVAMLTHGGVTILHTGEPEPQDIAISNNGLLYWTCRTAGVILHQDRRGRIGVLLQGLNHPMGIAINRRGDRLYWTEVPTPGVSGAADGLNRVWELNLRTMRKTLVHYGDPEPTDVTVAPDGSVLWTCTSAGVIVAARRRCDWYRD